MGLVERHESYGGYLVPYTIRTTILRKLLKSLIPFLLSTFV